MALTRKWIPSPNYSSRGGAKVRLIVLHTAEGATTIESLGNFFAKSSVQASSHTGIDDKPGVIGEYVKPGNKAWTAKNANPIAVQTELCGFAKWSESEWRNKHSQMLKTCAEWIAEEAKRFDIPIVKLNAAQAQGSGRGVCQHSDLGSWGGGHWDCGSGFPIDYVLNLAKEGGSSQVSEQPGYPQWFWDWNQWYINTPRDPKARPANAPQQIPQWAWDGQSKLLNISRKYGMTKGERDWIVWYNGGKKGPRPDVPQTIPYHWWDDQSFVLKQTKGASS